MSRRFVWPRTRLGGLLAVDRGIAHFAGSHLLQAFRIGAKLWRTDQASLDDYINTGQFGRYRRQLGPLRPVPGKPDDVVLASQLEVHLVGEADEPTNYAAEIGRICPIPQLTANHTQTSQSLTCAQVPVCRSSEKSSEGCVADL